MRQFKERHHPFEGGSVSMVEGENREGKRGFIYLYDLNKIDLIKF